MTETMTQTITDNVTSLKAAVREASLHGDFWQGWFDTPVPSFGAGVF
jgi:hypothetical protein